MKRVLGTVALASALALTASPAMADITPAGGTVLGGTSHQGGIVGQRNMHTGALLPVTTFGCQYDVYAGHLYAQGYHETRWPDGTVTSSTDVVSGRAVSVLVTNNARTKHYELHGYTVAGLYQHRVYHTYTQRNVKVWVSGHRCEGT